MEGGGCRVEGGRVVVGEGGSFLSPEVGFLQWKNEVISCVVQTCSERLGFRADRLSNVPVQMDWKGKCCADTHYQDVPMCRCTVLTCVYVQV